MTSEQKIVYLLSVIKQALEHSCPIEDADFGYHSCCQQRDYEGHKQNCYLQEAYNLCKKGVLI